MSLRFFFRKLRYLWKFDFTQDFYRKYLGFSPNPQFISKLPPGNMVILSPHPDDETIGAGGSILKRDRDSKCALLITAHQDERRLHEAREVSNYMMIDELVSFNQDNGINGLIKKIKSQLPKIILAPNPLENHPDHLKCTNILLNSEIDSNVDIYFYEVWTPITPNVLVDISDSLDGKLTAMKMYKSQLKDKDYVSGTEGLARYRALFAPEKCLAAEAFFKVTLKDLRRLNCGMNE